jgi:tripartite-type tricarboxylate transporter receptor subunit TctC
MPDARWTRAIGLFCKELNLITPQFIPSGGGYNAAVSAMKKEVDFAACGLPEGIDLIQGAKLKALAYWGTTEVILKNGDKVPTLVPSNATLNKYTPYGGWVGMAVPSNTPQTVIDTLIHAYKTAVNDQSFFDFCNERYFSKVGKYGKDADEYAKESTSTNAYLCMTLALPNRSSDTRNPAVEIRNFCYAYF